MAFSKNHKAVWKPASETREQRRERLTSRRDQQHSLKAGIIKTNLLWSTAIDGKTGKSRVRMLSAYSWHRSRYMPHQGKQECARRLRKRPHAHAIAA